MERLIQLKDEVAKNGINLKHVISELTEIREAFKAQQKPLCVKMCRLAYEYLESQGEFDVDIVDDRSEEDESSFEYFLSLLIHNENTYNQEELREYADLLIS